MATDDAPTPWFGQLDIFQHIKLCCKVDESIYNALSLQLSSLGEHIGSFAKVHKESLIAAMQRAGWPVDYQIVVIAIVAIEIKKSVPDFKELASESQVRRAPVVRKRTHH